MLSHGLEHEPEAGTWHDSILVMHAWPEVVKWQRLSGRCVFRMQLLPAVASSSLCTQPISMLPLRRTWKGTLVIICSHPIRCSWIQSRSLICGHCPVRLPHSDLEQPEGRRTKVWFRICNQLSPPHTQVYTLSSLICRFVDLLLDRISTKALPAFDPIVLFYRRSSTCGLSG